MRVDRNADITRRIAEYCIEIKMTIDRFGDAYDIFSSDRVYQNAVALCVLQIGELTTHFSDEFKLEYNEVPWNQIKALRNIVAHNYGKVDIEILWETITTDIPALYDYCKKILNR